jgi:serine/threonine-protein kinase PRP4
MEMNLRELTRKVGVGRGIKIDAVAQLTLQMLIALRHLQTTGVLHADIKPDNILINSRMNKIKLCDLGSALYSGSLANEPTPYLVSRFYRAPEVILGLPYGARLCCAVMQRWRMLT